MWLVHRSIKINEIISKRIHMKFQFLQVNSTHHRVVQLMGEAAQNGQVTMILRRKTPNPNMHELAHQQHQQHQQQLQSIQYPYDVIVSRNDNESFGIVVISAPNQYYGSTIGMRSSFTIKTLSPLLLILNDLLLLFASR